MGGKRTKREYEVLLQTREGEMWTEVHRAEDATAALWGALLPLAERRDFDCETIVVRRRAAWARQRAHAVDHVVFVPRRPRTHSP